MRFVKIQPLASLSRYISTGRLGIPSMVNTCGVRFDMASVAFGLPMSSAVTESMSCSTSSVPLFSNSMPLFPGSALGLSSVSPYSA